MNSRNLERLYPYLISLIVVIVLFAMKINQITIMRFDILISSIISISSTIIGFIITIIAILIGLLNERVMKLIKKNNAMNLFREYLISPVIIGFILIILSNILIFIVKEDCIISGIYFYMTTFLVLTFTLSLLRIGTIIYKVFGDVTGDDSITTSEVIKLGKEEFF